MIKWVVVGGIVLAGAAAVFIGRERETAKADELAAALRPADTGRDADHVDFDSFAGLPPPVARYFRRVLTDGQAPIRTASLRQSGVLRTDPAADSWLPFTASQLVVPPAPGFVWNARIDTPLGTHVRVLDGYVAGSGSGRVSLLSAIPIAADAGRPELNAGALHRFLAEAVWFPTALLPEAGVRWAAVDDRTAVATLVDGETTVSLEFRFSETGEVEGIYTPQRFGKFAGEYRQVPWEGHFRDYREWGGMRVPSYGEVGWHLDGDLQIVWQGELTDARYEFSP